MNHSSFQEVDFVNLAVQHFYVQYGSDSGEENAKNVVQACINSSLLEAKSEEKWVQMVSTAHLEVRGSQIINCLSKIWLLIVANKMVDGVAIFDKNVQIVMQLNSHWLI